MRHMLLASTAVGLLMASASFAQSVDASAPSAQEQPAKEQVAVNAPEVEVSDIIITATRRATPLQSVPLAVSAVTADSLQNTGAVDIRQLNQLAPSLLVSSTSSEATGAVARIRGIGTVGDNPGLESSVTTFIDGVYRNRTGIGLTDIGAIERIEVLRGPQGTLFGRNASSGLINVITKGPQIGILQGHASATYGNYDYVNLSGGFNLPVNNVTAFRLDGTYNSRDGFVTDVVSGRRINNRDRWLLRAQIGYEPTDTLKVRIIGDYTQRNEECCGGSYFPAEIVTRAADGTVIVTPSAAAGNTLTTVNPNGTTSTVVNTARLLRNLGGIVLDNDPNQRLTALTPGQSFRANVNDWGLSGEVNWDLGAAKVTSITAYRNWQVSRAQDADVTSNLDILNRTDYYQQFKTFTQELRFQGNVSILDWLVGGYYANERLTFSDNLGTGADYGTVSACTGVYTIGISAFASPTSPGCITPAFRPNFLRVPTANNPFGFGPIAGPTILAAFDRLTGLANRRLNDRYSQLSENWAVFSHNVLNLTDRLQFTAGVRYTQESKTLDATFSDNNPVCAQQRAALGSLTTSPTLGTLATSLIGLSCISNIGAVPNGAIATQRRTEREVTGNGVLSYKFDGGLLGYFSYSRGYKAGGFNLDRAGFNGVDPTQLQFTPETVNAYELGAKYGSGIVVANLALFYQQIDGFQLNTFNGLNFLVRNVPVTSKGIELEVQLRPTDSLRLTTGTSIGRTSYGSDFNFSTPLEAASLALLPGSILSNAPQYVFNGSATYTYPIPGTSLTALLYSDFRYQSEIRTASDLFPEKSQEGYILINARVGLYGDERRWGVELWTQNLLNKSYSQVGFNAPVQGSGTIANVVAGRSGSANSLFGDFLGEPRTVGITLRYKF